MHHKRELNPRNFKSPTNLVQNNQHVGALSHIGPVSSSSSGLNGVPSLTSSPQNFLPSLALIHVDVF